MTSQMAWLGGMVVAVAGLIWLLLWSTGDANPWGEEDDYPANLRPPKSKEDDGDD
jgi:hypothetical protein